MDGAAALRLTRVLQAAAREWAEVETGMAAPVTAINGVSDEPGTECYLFAFRVEARHPDGEPGTFTITVDRPASRSLFGARR